MSSSVQHALLRIRAPRVKITYDVEIGDSVEKKELPFVVGVMSDLAGENASNLVDLRERKFIEIDRDNFNAVLASINPMVTVTIKDTLNAVKAAVKEEDAAAKDSKDKGKKNTAEQATKQLKLSFSSMADFEPYQIAIQMPELKELLTTRVALVDLMAKLDGNDVLIAKLAEIVEKKDLRESLQKDTATIQAILEAAKMIKPESNLGYLQNLIASFAKALVNTEASSVNDIYGLFVGLIANIDSTVSTQLDEILHDKNYQKLEASWRGLSFLVFNSETGTSLKIRVLALSKDELSKDLNNAVEFDQSSLFKKIYEQEYGTLGGHPYSCLIGDYSFGRHAPDIKLLRLVATLAASAHAPFIGAVAPDMFDLETFSSLPTPRDLAKIFESSELAAWNSFRETEDARYVNLLLPRTLMRLPYGQDNPCNEFNYIESVDGKDNSKFCWGNPAFAMAHRITTAFSEYSWTSAIRGVEGGGKVDQLPAYTFKTPNGDAELKCPSEVAITDRREKELSDLGFIALCHAKGTDYSVFFSGQSTQKAKAYNTEAATANAAISARLPYLLNASRFAHYIKVMMRDKIGSFMTSGEIQTYLQNWLAEYVLLSDTAPQALKAQYPLREGQVQVVEVPGAPGSYKAVLFLRPHFQLEDLTVSLRLVAAL